MYRVGLYTELFLCYHPYLVSMLFADLLSLHLVTFLMFSILVHVTITEQQISPHRLPMQYWLKNHRLSSWCRRIRFPFRFWTVAVFSSFSGIANVPTSWQWNRQHTNFLEFNFSAQPLPVWKWRSWHCTVLARFSLSSKTVDGRATLFQGK